MEEEQDKPKAVEVEFVVEPNYHGWRLDRYLCVKIRRLSRTRAQRIIENSLTTDSKKKLKPSTLVVPGMRLHLRRFLHDEPDDIPDEKALIELYSDDSILVLNKPSGLPIHPTARYHHGTLVSQLKVRHGHNFQADPAHRLDRETSGLVVCTKTTEAGRVLKAAFAEGRVQKEYVGICEGHPPQDVFEVDAAIAEGSEVVRIAVRIDVLLGKPSKTLFRVEKRFWKENAAFSLLRAFPQTGRQHQIRVHLKHVGFPLVGDKIYGPDEGYFDRFSKGNLEEEAWQKLRMTRHALHAAKIRFQHPATRDWVEFEAPLPHDFVAFIEQDITQK